MGMAWLKRQPNKHHARHQFKKARPLRNPNLIYNEDNSGLITITVPITARRGVYTWIQKWFPVPPEKEVELEELGSMVWKLCDGKNTVHTIANKLCESYKLSKAEADASLIAFLETLAKRNYIWLKRE